MYAIVVVVVIVVSTIVQCFLFVKHISLVVYTIYMQQQLKLWLILFYLFS